MSRPKDGQMGHGTTVRVTAGFDEDGLLERGYFEQGDLRLRLERSADGDGTMRLLLMADDGEEVSLPRSVLDEVWSGFALDPLAFLGMGSVEREEALARICGVDPEFRRESVDGLRVQKVDAERELERLRTSLAARRAEIGRRQRPKARLDPQPLSEERERAVEKQKEVEHLAAVIEELEAQRARIIDKSEDSQTDVTDLESDLRRHSAKLKELQDGGIPDPSELTRKLIDLIEVNKIIDVFEEIDRLEPLELVAEVRVKELAESIEDEKEEVTRAIRASGLPIEGLEFSLTEGFVLNGLAFDQASMAEKLRTSLALAFAEAGDLRVMLVRDGHGLDRETLTELAAMADELGCQLWIETIRDGRSQAELLRGATG